ncbi:MAG TPA: ADYC domain-containing protein, partial [Kofleriaceae bacterium]|nr:ADYC domain-containing protein [Kofleriaceae bacterium]
NGSQLTGTRNGQPVSGAAVVGVTMNGLLSTGATLPMRIDLATLLPAPNNDVWAYGVSYQSGASWLPLCGSSGGKPILAVPLQGTWNYGSGVTGGGAWTTSATAFTLGCRGAALAKCVELGYKPWKTVGGVLLRDHHQACTRAIRADYCGNGKSYTADGTLINIYDNKGVQADAAPWPVDAEWLTTGSRCIHATRAWKAGQGVPTCWASKLLPVCGLFAGGTLIIDEYK